MHTHTRLCCHCQSRIQQPVRSCRFEGRSLRGCAAGREQRTHLPLGGVGVAVVVIRPACLVNGEVFRPAAATTARSTITTHGKQALLQRAVVTRVERRTRRPPAPTAARLRSARGHSRWQRQARREEAVAPHPACERPGAPPAMRRPRARPCPPTPPPTPLAPSFSSAELCAASPCRAAKGGQVTGVMHTRWRRTSHLIPSRPPIPQDPPQPAHLFPGYPRNVCMHGGSHAHSQQR